MEKRHEGGGQQAAARLDDDLKRELAISRALRHPNCIHVEDLFRTRVYIVMDFMPNGTVGSVVRKNGPLCEWDIKIWYPAILSAVAYLHRNKVAHRDLKLDNVLLDGHFNPVLGDYGFSRYVMICRNGGVLPSDTYCGTRSYNPPQILMRMPYDPYKVSVRLANASDF